MCTIARVPKAKRNRYSTLSPDCTPAGIMRWLTGQKHKPLDEEPLIVTVRLRAHSNWFTLLWSCGVPAILVHVYCLDVYLLFCYVFLAKFNK
jgi:hypothetical protein